MLLLTLLQLSIERYVRTVLSVGRVSAVRGELHCNVSIMRQSLTLFLVLALDLEGVHDVKLHHPSSSVATSNQ